MKLVVTVADAGMACNIGGSVEMHSAIIELKEPLPLIVQGYFAEMARVKKYNADNPKNKQGFYQSLVFSILSDEVNPC